ncbi:hypothetical protein DWU98_20470 [Dyella monticola]|uniref:Uncharacterized protein n=1 Tax=Dyella monticola TaxID=1927958 RepID=A0A370WS89_9GAMM|nr:hypothetical protein [Dyella monticola]RDS78897.1 hypothetical protein DWU98_20470 [Dyella monticola]
MNKSDITFRSVVVAAGSGLGGVIAGGILVTFAVPKFSDSPPWLLPAIVIGILATLVVAVLTTPAIIEGRRRAKHGRE